MLDGIIEILFQGVIGAVGKTLKFLGILVLKILTLSNGSIKELNEKYKDSYAPFFIGLGIVLVLIYFFIYL